MASLVQEYFLRKGIAEPVVQFRPSGSFLAVVPPDWSSRWMLMTMHWSESNYHPGYYVADFYTPLRDGFARRKYFGKAITLWVEWDEYENFFLDWRKAFSEVYYSAVGRYCLPQPAPVEHFLQLTVAAWEVFVYCFDSWFASVGPRRLRPLVYRSLDPEAGLSVRQEAIQEVMAELASGHPDVLKTWKYEIFSAFDNYFYWLTKF